MKRALILRLQAPLASYGDTQVDHIGPTRMLPTKSQITGLLANAMGYCHGEFTKLQELQSRIEMASAVVCGGEELQDFQTVDLGQPHLREPGWTTRGQTEHRAGASTTKYGTHIRIRRYRADADILTAVGLSPANQEPTLQALKRALDSPARPLFIGRKSCLPASRILVGVVSYSTELRDTLGRVPELFPKLWNSIGRAAALTTLVAEWAVQDDRASSELRSTRRIVDERDWRNQLHGGERSVQSGIISLQLPVSEDS